MTAFFVTGSGTEIGKTYVSAAILTARRAQGGRVRALKPLMSGFDPARLDKSDAGRLLLACGRVVDARSVADICMHAFPPALAPNAAAQRAAIALDDTAIVDFVRTRLGEADALTLVEGAGGVLSPATDSLTNAALMVALGLPAIVVTANYLGAVSHTLTALEALDRRRLTIAAVVVSQPSPETPAPAGLIEELRRWRGETMIAAAHAVAPEALGRAILRAIL